MSFYTFLNYQSGVSSEEYKGTYEAVLAKRVMLEGEWEVALVEVKLPDIKTRLKVVQRTWPANQDHFWLRYTVEQVERYRKNVDDTKTMIVECNLIQPSLYENRYLQVLRGLRKSKAGSRVIFDVPIYHDVITKDFDRIKINIKYRGGENIPFDEGVSNCVLHFRKKRCVS